MSFKSLLLIQLIDLTKLSPVSPDQGGFHLLALSKPGRGLMLMLLGVFNTQRNALSRRLAMSLYHLEIAHAAWSVRCPYVFR
jgi:hypothetical protein